MADQQDPKTLNDIDAEAFVWIMTALAFIKPLVDKEAQEGLDRTYELLRPAYEKAIDHARENDLDQPDYLLPAVADLVENGKPAMVKWVMQMLNLYMKLQVSMLSAAMEILNQDNDLDVPLFSGVFAGPKGTEIDQVMAEKGYRGIKLDASNAAALLNMLKLQGVDIPDSLLKMAQKQAAEEKLEVTEDDDEPILH